MKLQLDPDDLQRLVTPIVKAAVAEILAQREEAEARLPDQLAYSEAHAARLLDLTETQLRDARRAGRITASRIWGRRIRYTREDLLAYLAEHREN